MRSRHEESSFEEQAIEHDGALDGERAAAEGEGTAGFRYDFSQPLPGMTVARETAALPWGFDAARDDGYPTLVERLLTRVWHVLYTLGDQQQEIARLRENTRQVLVRLGTA